MGRLKKFNGFSNSLASRNSFGLTVGLDNSSFNKKYFRQECIYITKCGEPNLQHLQGKSSTGPKQKRP
jgi:hypothetical protein